MPPRTRKALSVVQPGSVAPVAGKRAPKTVTEAAREGTPRELLVATRDRIAVAVENPNTPARDLAALTKRLMEIARDIEAIDARAKEEGAEDGGPTPDAEWEAI